MSTPQTPGEDAAAEPVTPGRDAPAELHGASAAQPEAPATGDVTREAAEPTERLHPTAEYPAGFPIGKGELPPPRTPAAALADRLDEGGFFEALFDVTFTKFVTRRLAGPVYIVGLAVIALSAIYGIITSLATAVATESAWGVLLFLFGLLLTVVAGMLAVLLLRVAIEVFVAIVSIAENTRRLRRDR